MPLWNGRSLRRNLALLCFILLFFYFSGRFVSRNTPPIVDDTFDTLEYVRPQGHQEMRPDGTLQVEWQQRNDPIDKESRIRMIDRKYCGRDRCRFMLPVAITEQESKAQEHFRQLAFLSGKLDRTIVLPNVHSSHLGACRKYPFSFYYDDDWLLQNQEHFSFITVEDFNKWITERNQVETPTSQEVYVEISENLHFLDKAKNCYEGILDYTGWPRKRFYLDDPEDFSRREGNYTEILLNALSDEARKREYIGDGEAPPLDVISLLYDRRFTYIENPEAYTPLSYSKRWTKIADAIAEQLSPFVAIHWRMERLEPVTNMVPCAQSLVNKVKDIESRSEKPLRLFLLTDYPHLLNTSKAVPESMSFKPSELKQDHHDAIKYVYTNLDVYLTILKRENQPIPYEELPADHWNLIPVTSPVRPPDMSVLGIIDKLVAMRAEYFLAGKPAVCGKQSSFTKRIMEERLQAYSAGNPTIRLPMDYFAL